MRLLILVAILELLVLFEGSQEKKSVPPPGSPSLSAIELERSSLMATLREVQYTLQEKIEQVRRRDRLIDELEDELLAREREINAMKREIRRYQNVVAKLTAINNTLRSSVKPGSTIVTSAPIIKAFENRPDFKAPKRQNAIRSSKNNEMKTTTPPPAVAAVATIATTSLSKNAAAAARADDGASSPPNAHSSDGIHQHQNMVTMPIATKDSKVAHVISLALSVQQDAVDGAGDRQSQSLDDGNGGRMTPIGRRRWGGGGQHGQHQLRQQRQTKSNEGPSSAPITPPEAQNGAATDSSTFFQKHKTMLPGLTALSSSSSASLRSSNESTLSNNGQLSKQQHHHSNGGLSPNSGNKIFASASSAGVIAPVLVSLAVGGEAGGVSPISLCAVGQQQQHNETVKRQISTKKAKHFKQGGLINFAKKNS